MQHVEERPRARPFCHLERLFDTAKLEKQVDGFAVNRLLSFEEIRPDVGRWHGPRSQRLDGAESLLVRCEGPLSIADLSFNPPQRPGGCPAHVVGSPDGDVRGAPAVLERAHPVAGSGVDSSHS